MGRDNGGLWWKTSKVGRSMRAHDCNGDKTADSSGECDFIESIVALQYRHHLDIIYCTFREKWVLEVLFFFQWDNCLGKRTESKHFRFLCLFRALNNLLEQSCVFCQSWVSSPSAIVN